jgi:hypothetical protein
MNRRGWCCASVLIAWIAISCDAPTNLVRIAPTPRVDSVAFELSAVGTGTGPGSLVYGVSVVDCDDKVFWTIASDGTRALPQRFTYGSVIPGFETRAGPLPLAPGCYKMLVSRAKPLRFEIAADGSATPRP